MQTFLQGAFGTFICLLGGALLVGAIVEIIGEINRRRVGPAIFFTGLITFCCLGGFTYWFIYG